MITLDIFGPGSNKKLNEAVGLDRSKVPNYPNDPATIQHRIDTAKAILSDPKSDPDSRRAAAAILAQHKGVAEGYDDEEHPIRDDGNEGRPGKQRYPGKLPNKGVAEGFGSNYAEQLAQEVFNHNPNIKDENQVLNLGYNISKNDLGRKAQGIFRDEDFPSDFVSAYFWLQKQGVTEGNRDLDAYEKDVRASQQGFGRPADHRGLSQELAHERNNLQVYINGKPWKVFPGRGYADSQEEFKFLQKNSV